MTLKLTPDILAAAYAYLNSTEPFVKWNLLDAEDVTFKVVKSRIDHAWLRSRHGKFTIAISGVTVGHTMSLMATMAHEMVHLHETLAKLTPSNVQHGAAFKRLAKQVCRHHGFDPKTF